MNTGMLFIASESGSQSTEWRTKAYYDTEAHAPAPIAARLVDSSSSSSCTSYTALLYLDCLKHQAHLTNLVWTSCIHASHVNAADSVLSVSCACMHTSCTPADDMQFCAVLAVAHFKVLFEATAKTGLQTKRVPILICKVHASALVCIFAFLECDCTALHCHCEQLP